MRWGICRISNNPQPQRREQPVIRALVIGLTSVALSPFIPVLTGVGNVAGLALIVIAAQQSRPRRRLVVAAALLANGVGLLAALVQLAAALASGLGLAPPYY